MPPSHERARERNQNEDRRDRSRRVLARSPSSHNMHSGVVPMRDESSRRSDCLRHGNVKRLSVFARCPGACLPGGLTRWQSFTLRRNGAILLQKSRSGAKPEQFAVIREIARLFGTETAQGSVRRKYLQRPAVPEKNRSGVGKAQGTVESSPMCSSSSHQTRAPLPFFPAISRR